MKNLLSLSTGIKNRIDRSVVKANSVLHAPNPLIVKLSIKTLFDQRKSLLEVIKEVKDTPNLQGIDPPFKPFPPHEL